MVDREALLQQIVDYEYIKMVAVIVLLIVLIFYFTYEMNHKCSSVAVPATKTEAFSPYVSTLAHDIKRSDPQFDFEHDYVPPRNNEYQLFEQTLGWAMHP
jgi:hypothetical protein